VSVASELSTHGAAEGRVVREEAIDVHPPLKFMFVCESSIGEGGVFFVEYKNRSVCGGAGKEGTAFGGTRKGCMSVFDVVFYACFLVWCIYIGCGFV
jgi:hypothetical protein